MDKKEGGNVCENCCSGGNCGHGMGMHGCCHGGKHHLLKVILKLVIIMLVFFFGFKIGVMTGYLQAGYGGGAFEGNGFGMMRGYNYYNNLPNANGGVGVPAQIPAQ